MTFFSGSKMKKFYGFTEEDIINSRIDKRPFVLSSDDDEDDEAESKKAKIEDDKPYAVKSAPPPISTVPELPENELYEAVEAKRETPSPSTDVDSSPATHYLIRITDGHAVPIDNPTFEDLRRAFPCAMSNVPPQPPPSPPSAVKEESKVVTQEINPAFVEKHQCFYRGKEVLRPFKM